jgi:hypothetical protein
MPSWHDGMGVSLSRRGRADKGITGARQTTDHLSLHFLQQINLLFSFLLLCLTSPNLLQPR